MPLSERSIFTFRRCRTFAAGTLCCAVAMIAGCKNNTSAAAVEHSVGKPPVVTISPVQPAVPLTNPLTSEQWSKATWITLAAPANTYRTTAPTRAAILVTPTTLYAAFVCEKQPIDVAKDSAVLFLDTHNADDHMEMVKITVDSAGPATCTWIRSDGVPTPHSDASPDLGYTFYTLPDFKVPGLTAHVGQGTDQGAPVWTSVVAIPLQSLPQPLKAVATPGAHWKFNLIRSVMAINGNGEKEQLQANLSPIYVGAQECTTWRMAELDITQ